MNTTKVGKFFRDNIISTAAIYSFATPFMAASEYIGGDTAEQSIIGRATAISLSIAGMGKLYSYLRDKFHNKISFKRSANDAIYGFLYGSIFTGLLTIPKMKGIDSQYLLAITGGGLSGTIIGVYSGYLLDNFHYLFNNGNKERLPPKIKKLSRTTKKTLALSILGISALSSFGIEYMNYYFTKKQPEKRQVLSIKEMRIKKFNLEEISLEQENFEPRSLKHHYQNMQKSP